MVDRDTEIRNFEKMLAEVLQGKGKTIFLAGEAGIGKTRLTNEFAEKAKPERVRILKGQCNNKECSYELFKSVLTDHFKLTPGDNISDKQAKLTKGINILQLGEETETFLSEFLIGSSISQVSNLHSIIDGPRQTDKFMLFEQIISLFYQIQKINPLLILMEDLHVVDIASLELLEALINRLKVAPARILICGTYRTEEKRYHLELGSMLRRVSRYTDICFEQELMPLSEEDGYELIDRILQGFSSIDEDIIYHRSDGIPFIIQQILRLLYSTGKLEKTTDGWHIKPNVDLQQEIPKETKELLLRRVEMLPNETRDKVREFLECASVMALSGKEFCAEILEKVLGRDIADELDLCEREGLIRFLDEKSARDYWYEFSHSLMKDVIYEQIGRKERDRIHNAIGKEIETHFADQLELMYESLVEHFEKGRNFEKALEYSIQVGKKAKSNYAFIAACVYYEKAIKHCRILGIEQVSQKEQLIQLLLECGELQEILGNWNEGLANLNEALKLGVKIENNSLIAWSKLRIGRLLLNKGNWKECLPYFNESLETFEKLDDQEGIANVSCSIGVVLMEQGLWNEALTYHNRDLDISQLLNDYIGICRAYQNIGMVFQLKGQWDEALEYYKKAQELATNHSFKHEIAKTIENIGSIYENECDWDKALNYYEEARKNYELLGDRSRMANTLTRMGYIYYVKTADIAIVKQAYNLCMQAFNIFEQIGDKAGLTKVYYNLAEFYQYECEYVKALKYAENAVGILEVLEDRKGLADIHWVIGEIYLMTAKNAEDLQKSLDHYQSSLSISESLGYRQGTAWANACIGWFYNDYDNYQEALKYAEAANIICQTLQDKLTITYTLWIMGNVYEKQAKDKRDLNIALEYYKQALSISEEMEAEDRIALVNSSIGNLYAELGEREKAIEYYKIVESIWKESDEIESYLYTALIQFHLENFSEASKSLSLAEISFVEVSRLYNLIEVYKVKSEILLKQNEIDNANNVCQKGLSLARDLGRKYMIAEFYNIMGQIHLFRKCYDVAETSFTEGINIAKKIGTKILVAKLNRNIIELYIARGEKEKAQAIYSKLIEFYQKLDASRFLLEMQQQSALLL